MASEDTDMATPFEKDQQYWQALRSHFATNPPEPADRFLIGIDLPPRVAYALAKAHSQGIIAGSTKHPLEIPVVEGNDATAATVLQMVATSGYVFGSRSQTDEMAPRAPKAPKVSHPEWYKGGQHEFQVFQGQLQLVFQADPARFQNDKSKIVYAASFLRGPARDWWTPNINPHTGGVKFDTYTEFLTALSNAFDNPDSEATAAREIRRLQQKDSSCADYYAKFITLAAKLTWNDAAKFEQFRYGLSDDIKRALVVRDDPPGTLKEYTHVCITIDNRQRSFNTSIRSTRKHRDDNHQIQPAHAQYSGPPAGGFQNTTATGTHSGPMDLGTVTRYRISNTEKEYRRANNLYLRCGGKNHIAKECRAGPPRGITIMAVQPH